MNSRFFNPKMFGAQEAIIMNSNTLQTVRRFSLPPFASLTSSWFRGQPRIVNQAENPKGVSLAKKAERVQSKLQEKYASYSMKANRSESEELNLYNTTIPYHKKDNVKRDF